MSTVAIFVGTRPEAVKLAPVVAALHDEPGLEPVVISTGQHREMLDSALELFGIVPDAELSVMRPGQTLASLTARLMEGMDACLEELEPDLCLVQGDTTTAFTGALAAFYRGVAVGHVEAGLRTGDLLAPFPEEANRKLVSNLAALHFAPTEQAAANLLAEGVPADSVHVTGNTVIDALNLEVSRQDANGVLEELRGELEQHLGARWWEDPVVLVTGHRRESFGQGFEAICASIAELAQLHPDHRFVYPVHLNPRVQEPVRQHLSGLANVALLPPLDYAPFVALMRAARLVLTDSGGIQEEAPGLAKPVLVMRETTERPEGVDAGTVRLVGTDRQRIVSEVDRLLTDELAHQRMARAKNPYGDGHASERIVAAIRERSRARAAA